MSESDAHIQDSDILEMTGQEVNKAKTHIRFVATLPSGRQLSSEWLDPGRKREAMLKWLEAVRANIAADEEEARLRAKRRASPIDAPSVESPPSPAGSTTPTPNTTSATPAGRTPPTHNSVSSSAPCADPSAYVRQEYVKAAAAEIYWKEQLERAAHEADLAHKSLNKWKTIAQSIGVVTSEENLAAAAGSVESGGVQQASSEP